MEKKSGMTIFASPILRKIATGITGLGLVFFVLVHMLGNLQYFSPDGDAYNVYTHKLESLGPILYAIEIGLLAFFVLHAVIGTSIYLKKRRARPVSYQEYGSAGTPSRQSLSSRSMIVTGIILLVFLVFHLWSFKYGPGVAEGYVVEIDGTSMRDLKRLVAEKFSHASYAFGYTAVMLLLAVHLRHGVWSALQSLGAIKPRLSGLVYTIGALLGLLIAFGFLVLPLWIYFTGGAG